MPTLAGFGDEHTRSIEPAPALAAETLKLERLPSAERGMRSAECPAEIALMWQTTPFCMPIPHPHVKGSVQQIVIFASDTV